MVDDYIMRWNPITDKEGGNDSAKPQHTQAGEGNKLAGLYGGPEDEYTKEEMAF